MELGQSETLNGLPGGCVSCLTRGGEVLYGFVGQLTVK